jgi:two-component system, OmpR family, sensor histidine kinase MprB
MTSPIPSVRERLGAVDRRWRNSSLVTRLTTVTAFAATVAIVAVIAVAYIAVRHELLSNVDSQLSRQVDELQVTTEINPASGLPYIRVSTRVGEVGGYAELITSSGQAQPAFGQQVRIPVTPADLRVASQGGGTYYDATVNDLHLRVLARPLPDAQNEAVLIALPLTAVDSQLHKLRVSFLFLALCGLGLVIAGGWLVVRRTLRPVAKLTETAEQIAVTRDLTTRITDYGSDELGRLASTFNLMLDALERSVGQQRQLILDASHELRTPLASLRTNVEVLHDVDRLSEAQRRALLDGIVTQLDELTALVADVVELARGDIPESAQEDVALDDLVTHAVARARRHWPNVIFMLDALPVTVRGVPARLDRAIANLLDNAGKFSPAGSVVDATVSADGTVTVADRGPGVPEDAVAFVFDRFYRADEARAMPGSGLGLAIVKQVVENHHGTVNLTNRPGGGTLVEVKLPPIAVDEGDVPMVEAQMADSQPVS